jgi:hypothetical protein
MPVSPFAPDAVRFCAIGALRNAAFQIMQGNECAAMQLARAIEFEVLNIGASLESVNDGSGREAVAALLRKELAAATSRLAEHRSRALLNAFPLPPPGECGQSAAPAADGSPHRDARLSGSNSRSAARDSNEPVGSAAG